jgi:hypothetical protein
MMRRDYFLRIIEEFIQALARIQSLKAGQSWHELDELVAAEFKRLADTSPEELLRLDETELLAKIIRSDSGQAVKEKVLLLATLLKEAGDSETAQGNTEKARAVYLKGLHLLLGVLLRNDAFEVPWFVPKVEEFVAALADAHLPSETEALLMQHYELTGQYGRAEDSLYSLMELLPAEPKVLQFGLSFYQRLAAFPDAQLADGNLPRKEVEAGLEKLNASLVTIKPSTC